MHKPVNRTTLQIGPDKYKIWASSVPLFYKKPDGTFDDIDTTPRDTKSNIGDISLIDKNCISIGVRKGNNPYKVCGLRPDTNQHLGTQQLEFTLVSVEVNGESRDFNVDSDFDVKVKGRDIYQLVRIDDDCNDFKVEFDIHSQNMPIVNEKYESKKTVRDYGFQIENVGEKEGLEFLKIHAGYEKLDKEIPFLDCFVGKVTDKFIGKGGYSNDEEFDGSLDSYSVSDFYPNGSSVFFENCIVLTAHYYNIENFEEIILFKLCEKYGLEDFNDEGYGRYLTKDGKKVLGYDFTEDTFLLFINTQDIPDDAKKTFKRKDFSDTSFLDLNLDDFVEDFKSMFDLKLGIDIDESYYKGDYFAFAVNDHFFTIKNPVLFNSNKDKINLDTFHTLKDNGDGSYRYTKYFSLKGALKGQKNVGYIDVNVTGDATFSGYYYRFSGSSANYTTTNYNTQRNATTCTNASLGQILDTGTSTWVEDGVTIMAGWRKEGTTSNFGTTHSYHVNMRAQIYDTSGINSTVTGANFVAKCAYQTKDSGTTSSGDSDRWSDIEINMFKASFTTASFAGVASDKDNWNDMDGFTSSWAKSDLTSYFASDLVVNSPETINLGGLFTAGVICGITDTSIWDEYTKALNSTALTDIENEDDFEVIFLDEAQYDNLGVYTTISYGKWGQTYLTVLDDHSDTDMRSYLEVTVDTPTVTDNATFFGTHF